MKSKMNAMATIAMTYAITRPDASRVLERDALQHLGDAHATVCCALERIVHLLPFHHVERIGMPGEESAHCGVIERIALFLQFFDLRDLLAHELRLANGGNAGL